MTARRPTTREISSWAAGGGWALCIAKLRFGNIAGVIRPGSDAICCVPCDEPGVKPASPYSVIDVSSLHCTTEQSDTHNTKFYIRGVPGMVIQYLSAERSPRAVEEFFAANLRMFPKGVSVPSEIVLEFA